MNVYRTAAAIAAACLVGVSLTACQGGITTPTASSSSPPASSSPPSTSGSSRPASSPVSGVSGSGATGSATTGSGSSDSGTTVNVNGIGSFPIPPGADVLENVNDGGTTDIVLSGVSASEISSFYGSALPQAGFTVTDNTNATGADINGTAIEFTGHGYKGDIGATTSLGISGISGLGLGGNIIGITLTAQ